MIKASHNKLYEVFFDNYIRLLLKIDFREVNIIRPGLEDQEKAVLLLGNHFSWWDGFFARYINNRVFRRRFHVMMLEDPLKKRMFLNKLGAFSIKKNSKTGLESLEYAAGLLEDKNNLVLLFPQGSIQSHHNRPLTFEKGWFRILNKISGHFQVVFMAGLVDYFSHRKPTLSIYLENYNPGEPFNKEVFQDAYNAFFENCITQQKEPQ